MVMWLVEFEDRQKPFDEVKSPELISAINRLRRFVEQSVKCLNEEEQNLLKVICRLDPEEGFGLLLTARRMSLIQPLIGSATRLNQPSITSRNSAGGCESTTLHELPIELNKKSEKEIGYFYHCRLQVARLIVVQAHIENVKALSSHFAM